MNRRLRYRRGLCFHDGRHAAGTNLRKAGIGTSIIMAMFGRKTMVMFNRYDRIDLDDGREAMRKFESYLSTDRKEDEKEKEEGFYCIITAAIEDTELAFA